jgi:hypothetical protein
VATDWLDPAVSAADQADRGDNRLDAGEQQESAPTSSGVHFLIAMVVALTVVAAGAWPSVVSDRRLRGRPLRVLLPPPRWTPNAA